MPNQILKSSSALMAKCTPEKARKQHFIFSSESPRALEGWQAGPRPLTVQAQHWRLSGGGSGNVKRTVYSLRRFSSGPPAAPHPGFPRHFCCWSQGFLSLLLPEEGPGKGRHPSLGREALSGRDRSQSLLSLLREIPAQEEPVLTTLGLAPPLALQLFLLLILLQQFLLLCGTSS